jgi:Na+/H+ antiporter NhaD/arsenite permease-like protein
MIPIIHEISEQPGFHNGIWWAFALGAVFSGNGTMIASTANIISTNICKNSNYPVTFWQFTKYGAVIAGISFAMATAYVLIFEW